MEAINPADLTFHVLRAAEAAGARVCAKVRVTKVMEVKNRWVEVRYANGYITADHALICSNGVANPTLADGLKHRINPVWMQAIATQPLQAEALARAGFKGPAALRFEDGVSWPSSLRILPDRRVLFVAPMGQNQRPNKVQEYQLKIIQQLQSLLGLPLPPPISLAWRIQGSQTTNGLPMAAALGDSRRIFYAGGMNAESLSFGFWLGQAVADVATLGTINGHALCVSDAAMPAIRFPRLQLWWQSYKTSGEWPDLF
jgi:glycine/D-amino acid oxidase-like deaminating enzyme